MFPGNAAVTLLFLDATSTNPAHSLGAAQTAANGSLSQSVTLPAQATNGKATIEVVSSVGIFGATVIIQAALALNPPTAAAGAPVVLSGDGYNPLKSVTLTLNGAPLVAPSVVTTALGHFDAGITLPSTLAPGTVILGASDGSVTGVASVPLQVSAPSPSPSASPGVRPGAYATVSPLPLASSTASPFPIQSGSVVTPLPLGRTNTYFAEGFTGKAATNGKVTFEEALNLFNPGTQPATATITYFVQGGSAPRQVQRAVAADSVLRESVNKDVGPDQSVSVQIASAQTLLVSRTITRVSAKGARLDGSQSAGVTAAATRWGFPEGYTGISFQEYLSLLNPGTSPAHVTVLLAPQAASNTGAPGAEVTVPAYGRATVNIRALNQHGQSSVGMLVSSDVPVIAERVEYFGDGAGSGKVGAFVSPGFTTPGTTLRLAYASAGGTQPAKHGAATTGDQMYVTVLNPSQSGLPVRATLTVSDATGSVVGTPYSVNLAPQTRQTIVLSTLLGTHALSPCSIAIQASGPVEAEGAQYVGGSPNTGHHPGMVFPAVAAATTTAYLPDVSTHLPSGAGVHRLVYVYGAAAQPLQLQVAYFGEAGRGPTATYTVPGGGILTIDVNNDTAHLSGRGPLAMSLAATPGSNGTFIAVTTGISTDGLSALEGTAVTGP
jgi:hypothetical protein